MRYNIIKEGGKANEEKTKEKDKELHRDGCKSLNRCGVSDSGNCTTHRSSGLRRGRVISLPETIITHWL